MSAIAGIFRLSGAAPQPEDIVRMTASMPHRAPDGVAHWETDSVSLGHGMFCTTPEARLETQPWASESKRTVLVMDGRVDNRDELRHALLQRGAVLRNTTDAELVLRAYDVWGEDCADRIIGEFVFFIWDQPKRRLFAARDAIGVRHFYYYQNHNFFAFCSEIKGLLTLPQIPRKLNEERLLDNIVDQYDRDDAVGTFYQGIFRLPAGHCMRVNASGLKTWRYWNPGNLEPLTFSSMDECAEAFLEQLRIAVKCRLRSCHPVGAMLSGGLDSSSVVGLIRKEFRNELAEPLRTYTLSSDDREHCQDWIAVQEMLREGWLNSKILTPSSESQVIDSDLDAASSHDEPFVWTAFFAESLVLQAAARDGTRIVLEGMAGDALFQSLASTEQTLAHNRSLPMLRAYVRSLRRHGYAPPWRSLAYQLMADLTPEPLRKLYRSVHPASATVGAPPGFWQAETVLRPSVGRNLVSRKQSVMKRTNNWVREGRPVRHHAEFYLTNSLPFSFESMGELAAAAGVETRSPQADRRLIEFALRMPPEAKMWQEWYKPSLRASMREVLPEPVRLRADLGNHPGPAFIEHMLSVNKDRHAWIFDASDAAKMLEKWLDPKSVETLWESFKTNRHSSFGHAILKLAVLAKWLHNLN